MSNLIKKKNLAVYTAIFGGYDKVKSIPEDCWDLADYYIFSDVNIIVSKPWQLIISNGNMNFNNVEKNRHIKFFPTKYLSDYESSLYIDGNIQIMSNFHSIIDKMTGSDFSIFEHPIRNSIIKECAAIFWMRRISDENLIPLCLQLLKYKETGYLLDGLCEANIIYRKHSLEVRNLMNDWWSEFTYGIKRDQISLPYLLWLHSENLKIRKLNNINIRKPGSPFYCHPHKANTLKSLKAKILRRTRMLLTTSEHWENKITSEMNKITANV